MEISTEIAVDIVVTLILVSPLLLVFYKLYENMANLGI